jgi:hypothetical protein
LESTSFRREEGAASVVPPIWPRQPSSRLKLKGSKGRALSGVEGQSPSPSRPHSDITERGIM